ncbi:MAG: hypothetical protein Fur0022_23770 [Anaerolineales bacterium]
MTQWIFPNLEGWEATKATLHAYSKVMGALPRAHAVAHPKWWHISLKIAPDGLVTDNMPLPNGGIFALKMNFFNHAIQLITSYGDTQSWSMEQGWTASQLAEHVLSATEKLGLTGEYARQKFENDEPRAYDPYHAQNYFAALVNVEQIFKQHRANIVGEVGPIQLWPHGFDLAFEWFGTRQVEFEEHGLKSSFPAQINLGFSPGESSHPAPYFYSNPFPFEANFLLEKSLPHGARWFTDSWQGSILPYTHLVGDAEGGKKLLAYAAAVFDLASPGLMI